MVRHGHPPSPLFLNITGARVGVCVVRLLLHPLQTSFSSFLLFFEPSPEFSFDFFVYLPGGG